MAATTVLETAFRSTLADAIDTAVGATGHIKFETSGDAEVADIVLGNPAFGSASSGVITLEASTEDSNCTAGTIEHASLYANTTKLAEFNCTATGGGGTFTMSSLALETGDTLSIASFTITVPSGA
jgi:hypothetical protein